MAMGKVAWKIMGTGGAIVAGIIATKVIDAIWARAGQDEINPKNPHAPLAKAVAYAADHRSRRGRRADVSRPARPPRSTRSRRATCPPRSATTPSDPAGSAGDQPQVEGAGQRHPRPVGQVLVRRRLEHGQVGPRPHGHPPDVGAAQRPRPADGRRHERLGRRHPHLPHRERDDERHGCRVARARVAVGRQRDVDAGVEEAASVRVGRARRELDPGQQRGHGRAGGADERLDVGVGEEGAVVDARGPELDREPHARPRRELVAVHAQAEPGIPPGERARAGPRPR